MTITRMLTATAVAALGVALLLPGTALAGGGPDLGDATVDAVARLSDDSVTLTGTYTCFWAEAGTTDGTVRLDVTNRLHGSSQVSFAVECDGVTRPWSATGPRGGLTPGSVNVWGYLELCDADGGCPWDFVEGRASLVPVG